ncbi:uncharacterized protein B4U80_05358, partial [Leptotrombidium deliense]
MKNWIASIGFAFKPEEIMIDYEQAMIKAINKVFPNTRVRGCLFHYRQAIYRHVQECGLSRAYNDARSFEEGDNETNTNEVKRTVRRFLGLPFLPIAEIEEAHTEMMEHIDLNDVQMSAFCDYHLDTWMKDDAKYPKEIWNQYGNFWKICTTKQCLLSKSMNIEQSCSSICKEDDCNLIDYKYDRQFSQRKNKKYSTVRIYKSHPSMEINYIYRPKVTLLDTLNFIFSCISFTFGISLISILNFINFATKRKINLANFFGTFSLLYDEDRKTIQYVVEKKLKERLQWEP